MKQNRNFGYGATAGCHDILEPIPQSSKKDVFVTAVFEWGLRCLNSLTHFAMIFAHKIATARTHCINPMYQRDGFVKFDIPRNDVYGVHFRGMVGR